ncbi:MAG: hypothetical protein ACI8X5_002782 [Planctomycetota bacterium]
MRFTTLSIGRSALLIGLFASCSPEESVQPDETLQSEMAGPASSGSLRGNAPATAIGGGVKDLLLRTRRERRVDGKPEWLFGGDLDGDGEPEVVAATHSPGALLIWRDPLGDTEIVVVGDYPLRPAMFGTGSDARLAVATRADSSLTALDLSKPGEPQELFNVKLPDSPMVLTTGVLDEVRGEEIFVVTKKGLLVRVNASGVLSVQQLGESVPRCIAVMHPEAGLVVGFQSSDTLEVYRAVPGQDELEHQLSFPLAGTARDLLTMDVNRDGDRELLLVEGDQSGWVFGTSGVDLFGVDSKPLFFKTSYVPLRLLEMQHEASARWTVLAASSVATEIWDWNGTRPQRKLFTYAGQTPRDLLLRDIEGDGLEDFWVANRDAHGISLLRNDADGPIQPIKLKIGAFPNDIASGDLDGDGLDELFVVNAKDNDISVLLRKEGELARMFDVATGPSPRAVLATDVDLDGNVDLMWCEKKTSGTRLNIRLGDGERRLRAAKDFESIALGVGVRDFVVENFNGEGRSMVVAADQDARMLLWTYVTGDSDGLAHTEVGQLTLDGPPRSIATMHRDQTALGIAVTMQTSSDRSLVQIFTMSKLDGGGIEWKKRGEAVLSGAAIDLASGDIDGDGFDDLAYLAADHEGAVHGRMEPLIVKGGTPKSIGSFKTDLRPMRVLMEDLSGDGLADIFVANLDSHNVNSWLTVPGGQGKWKFRRLDDIGAGVGCIALVASDLDGDGDQDLVVVDSANDGVSLIFNETY